MFSFLYIVEEFVLFLRVLYAALLGAIIGFEREVHDKPAGLRTHMLVATGAALFTIMSYLAFPGADPARIAANVVVGIGFIGAGTILQMRNGVQGITTAASIWLAAAVGLTAGAGYYVLSGLTAILGFLILLSRNWAHKLRRE